MKKYDERETLFSRIGLEKGTEAYNTFYNQHPELKHPDDLLRGKSFRHNSKKSPRFKERFEPIFKHNKTHIKALFDMANAYPKKSTHVPLKDSFKANIKEITKYYGATDVGLTTLTDYSFYQVFGGVNKTLGINNYGEKILPKYKTAIVFTVLMDKDMINRAPQFEELLATEEGYLKLAHIGARLTMYLKDLGYHAMFNNSEYYLAPLVPLAYDAGLGEIGMANHLITRKYGNRVRLGAVFTTLELPPDRPDDFGLKAFCKYCGLCLMNCPSKAISHRPRMVNGRQFYKFDENKCYDMWIKSGTDCGTCIQSCPFSQEIDQDLVNNMKDNEAIMQKIFNQHLETYGRRHYLKKALPIVSLKEEE
ncbi:MAG: reductive dehalogenase domain-containing protein [Candidatus Izemoplasma sp.]|nr:reductive dehalogenase domain-containing protein [Candidatus Izemoplasma sp.]